ncbi:hypothetical protein AB0I77_46300 [Streptomyces sp. NPDC050619]
MNPLAAALLADFERVPEKKRNYARLLFTAPGFRELYLYWRPPSALATLS